MNTNQDQKTTKDIAIGAGGIVYPQDTQSQHSTVIPPGYVPDQYGSAITQSNSTDELPPDDSGKISTPAYLDVMRVKEVSKITDKDVPQVNAALPKDTRVVEISFGPFDSDNKVYYWVPKNVAKSFEPGEKISVDQLHYLENNTYSAAKSLGFRSHYYPDAGSGSLFPSESGYDSESSIPPQNNGGGEAYGPPAPQMQIKGLKSQSSQGGPVSNIDPQIAADAARRAAITENNPDYTDEASIKAYRDAQAEARMDEIHDKNKDQATGLSARDVINSSDPIKTVAMAKKAAWDNYNAAATNSTGDGTELGTPPPALSSQEQWSIMNEDERNYVRGVVAAQQAAQDPNVAAFMALPKEQQEWIVNEGKRLEAKAALDSARAQGYTPTDEEVWNTLDANERAYVQGVVAQQEQERQQLEAQAYSAMDQYNNDVQNFIAGGSQGPAPADPFSGQTYGANQIM